MTEAYPDNLAHLQGALLVLNLQLHQQVLRWRAMHHNEATPDELAGMYMSDREVDALLDGLYAANAPAADGFSQAPLAGLARLLDDARARHKAREAAALAQGVSLRLPTLCERLRLGAFEAQVVLLALAAELDRRYERLFGYLNDDLTYRLPTVDLALKVCCADFAERVRCRPAFAPDAPLRALRLLHLVDATGGLLSAGMRLDARVIGYLLEDDSDDAVLNGALTAYAEDDALTWALGAALPPAWAKLADRLANVPEEAMLVAIDGRDTAMQTAAAALLSNTRQLPLLVVDLAKGSPDEIIGRAHREALLNGSALALRNAEALAKQPDLLARLTQPPLNMLASGVGLLVFLLASEAPTLPVVRLRLPALDTEGRAGVWAALLNGSADQINLAELADRFRLTGEQIKQAVVRAQIESRAFDDALSREALFACARAQSGRELAGLAELITSIHTWDDLILPADTKMQLRTLEHWVRHRHTVYHDWGFGERVMLGRGLSVLFSGPSGTGKTMAAGILARRLELDLYRIDLSTVVSKYIGETEKNLSKIFDAAETANAILFFDEADALFGKRSEVKDAHDRYANIEVSYLLQRMEAYDGIAILATNFRQNLDQAFTRRLHRIIEFPLPSAADRARIWQGLLPARVPQADDVDLAYLARQFSLTGGNIRNCALAAAFAAAAQGVPVGMRHLMQAVARELAKTNQPIVRANFGDYYDWIHEVEA